MNGKCIQSAAIFNIKLKVSYAIFLNGITSLPFPAKCHKHCSAINGSENSKKNFKSYWLYQ